MNDTFMEENAIITRCLNGDTEAFEMIVTRYQEPLMALCWNILRNPEEARDTTQDTFVQAFRHLNRYDQVRSLKNWLYSIAYHRCLDKIRKHKSFQHYLKRGAPVEHDQRFGNLPSSDNPEFSDEIQRLLGRLPQRERIALLLKVRDGYTAVEISQIFDCAESTARVYLFNARRRLKKWLKEKNDV